MTATTTKPGRVMRNVTSLSPFDGLTVVRLTVAERGREDGYTVIHWADSFEVRVCHQDDPARCYRVVCAASDARPLVCECRGNLFTGRACKHMAAVAKLTERGQLVFPVVADAGHDREACE